MIFELTKIIISAILIALISSISKKNQLVGAVFASVPLISVLAIFWLYWETTDTQKVIQLSTNVFYLVLPSLSFFLIFPLLLKQKYSFYPSLFCSLALMIIFYFLMIYILGKLNAIS